MQVEVPCATRSPRPSSTHTSDNASGGSMWRRRPTARIVPLDAHGFRKLIESSAVVYGVADANPVSTAQPSEPSASIINAPAEI